MRMLSFCQPTVCFSNESRMDYLNRWSLTKSRLVFLFIRIPRGGSETSTVAGTTMQLSDVEKPRRVHFLKSFFLFTLPPALCCCIFWIFNAKIKKIFSKEMAFGTSSQPSAPMWRHKGTLCVVYQRVSCCKTNTTLYSMQTYIGWGLLLLSSST